MKKKVLLVATVQSHICQFHKALVEVLHEQNIEVHVAARDNLAEKNGMKLDFVEKVFNVPFSRSPKSLDNLKAYKQLKQIIDTNGYDVIHCNTPMGGIVTRLAAQKARKKGTTLIYTAHGFHFYEGAPKKNWLVFYPIEKFFSRLTDKLVTITQEDYNLASKKFHCEVHRIHGVGVDERRYYPADDQMKSEIRKELGYTDDEKLILCIGELLPNKNQRMAIRMMEKLVKDIPEAKLLIAGNGPERENLENLVKELRLENQVEFLDYCTYLEKYQRAVDLGVSCSKREGLPLNVVESMLTKNPVVVSKNRGHRELVRHEETGYLVNVNGVQAMYEHVKKLLLDEEHRVTMGVHAAAFAQEFNFTYVKEELKKVYGL